MVAAAGFAAYQVKLMAQARRMEAAMNLHREFMDLRPQRRFVIEELPELLGQYRVDELPRSAQEEIARLASFFERIGAMIDHDLIDRNLVFDLMTYSITASWATAEPVLLHWRSLKNAKMHENFELLQSLCTDWLSSHRPKRIGSLRRATLQVSEPFVESSKQR